jgi:predicted transcriptional regulator
MQENVARSTIFGILQRKQRELAAERKVGSGRPAIKMNKTDIKRLERRIDHKDGVSQRHLARHFNVSQPYINHVINTKTSIRYRKKIKIPRRSPAQKAALRPKCGRLALKFAGKTVVMDDESYFRISDCELSRNVGFYSSNISQTPVDVQCKQVGKNEYQVLVWTAISLKGMSEIYIVPSGQAVNQHVYLSECLEKRLIPFIRTVHQNDQVVFWPDLASAHYANKVQEYLKSQNIDYVARADNPANVPEVRPIEEFWAKIKQKVYDNNWQATTIDGLRRRIKWAFNKVDEQFVHRLGKACFTRVDTVRRKGFRLTYFFLFSC